MTPALRAWGASRRGLLVREAEVDVGAADELFDVALRDSRLRQRALDRREVAQEPRIERLLLEVQSAGDACACHTADEMHMEDRTIFARHVIVGGTQDVRYALCE